MTGVLTPEHARLRNQLLDRSVDGAHAWQRFLRQMEIAGGYAAAALNAKNYAGRGVLWALRGD